MISNPSPQFRESRDKFLSKCIYIVQNQHGTSYKDIIDMIDIENEVEASATSEMLEKKEIIDPYESFNNRDFSSKIQCTVAFTKRKPYKNIIAISLVKIPKKNWNSTGQCPYQAYFI